MVEQFCLYVSDKGIKFCNINYRNVYGIKNNYNDDVHNPKTFFDTCIKIRDENNFFNEVSTLNLFYFVTNVPDHIIRG